MNKILRTLTFVCLSLMAANAVADEVTWNYSFWRTAANGGEGFKGSTPTLTATIGGVEWTVTSDASAYSFYASQGQVLGSSSAGPSRAVMSTTGFNGKIKNVSVKAKAFNGCDVRLSVRVDGTAYVHDGEAEATVPTAAADSSVFIVFTPQDEALKGRLDISFSQTAATLRPIYIKRIEVVYDAEETEPVEVVEAPTFSLKGGWFISAKTVTLTAAQADDTIFYTTDETDPTTSATRTVYAEPIAVNSTMTISAVALRGDVYSPVVSETYTIRRMPELSFADYQYTAFVGDVGIFVEPVNPYDLPLEFESSDTEVATVDADGTVHAIAEGTAEISFYFDGNDDFWGGEGHYMLTVAEPVEDGIRNIEAATEAVVYNMHGQRVATTAKRQGLYIVDGKKRLVRP